MARKGDKAVLEPLAARLYAEGHNLSAIAEQLGVSVTSLSRWKDATRRPGADMDEWDRARARRQSGIQRLRDLFEDQLAYVEGLHAGERTAPMMDCLAKLGALLSRWDRVEESTTRARKQTEPSDDETAGPQAPDAADIARWKEMVGLS